MRREKARDGEVQRTETKRALEREIARARERDSKGKRQR